MAKQSKATKSDDIKSTLIFYPDIKQTYRMLWRPARVSVSLPHNIYKPFPLLKLTMPSYPKVPLPQPWGVSVVPDIKLACPVYPHPPDLSTFTTKASLVLTKYYDNHMRADPSSHKNTLHY